MGTGCLKLSAEDACAEIPALRLDGLSAALYSPHELRIESRDALPALAHWLQAARGVDFRWRETVLHVETPRIETTAGTLQAETVILCPGDALSGPFADHLSGLGVQSCKLQMLRLAPERPVTLSAAVMSDFGLARYHGYADLPAAAALKARLDAEAAATRDAGVHLIVVQSADGGFVVGDSHDYAQPPTPFAESAVDALILAELNAVLDLGAHHVTERWLGTYAWTPDEWLLRDAPDPATRLVVVTAGCGASTAFGIAEETIADLFAA